MTQESSLISDLNYKLHVAKKGRSSLCETAGTDSFNLAFSPGSAFLA